MSKGEAIHPEVIYAAEGLSIALPVAQEDIKATIEKLFITVENIARAQTAVCKLIDIVRDQCEHPEKVSVSHIGHLYARCTTCGREW